MQLLRMFMFLLLLTLATSLKKMNATRKLGRYTTKEVVEKAPPENHPCNLTITAIKISFPDMNNELFVNLIGYKEPNLVHLARCKGVCRETGSSIECEPTKTRHMSMKMLFRTQLANREPKEMIKELILDEHVQCGCMCKQSDRMGCTGRFNEASCECECDNRIYGEERMMCESRTSAYWDQEACKCKSKSVAIRGAGNDITRCSNSNHDQGFISAVLMRNMLMVAICLGIALIMLATTLHYKKKYKYKQAKVKNKKNYIPARQVERREQKKRNKKIRSSKRMKGEDYKVVDQDVIEQLFAKNDYELKGDEQYDQHGVRIDHQYIA